MGVRYWTLYVTWQVSIMAWAWGSGKLLGVLK
jgi:hypothetical protein